MKLYLLRHAESEYNLKNLINTNPNIKVSITKKGIEQAKKVADNFKEIMLDAVFTSEFLRCKQTADIVNQNHKLPLKVDSRLNEARVGFEGKPYIEYKKASRKDLFNFKGDGDECWQDLKKRIGDFLDDLKKEDFENVLIVTHQWGVRIINQIIKGLSDIEAHGVPVGNCEVITIKSFGKSA